MTPARPTLAAAAAISAAACAPYPLHQRLSDAEIRGVLAAHFHDGMSVEQVETGLDGLRVTDRYRLLYPAAPERPQVLLARVFDPGGFWIDQDDDLVQWVDISFVFEPPNELDRWLLFRDGVRYFHGDPVWGPKRRALDPVRRFPVGPPPPADPLEGAT